jgi:hypothetical protein
MDFRGLDRNPDLGALLWWERKGAPPPGSRIAAEVAKGLPPSLGPADGDDAREEAISEASRNALDAYLTAHPEVHADLRPLPSPPMRTVRPLDAE